MSLLADAAVELGQDAPEMAGILLLTLRVGATGLLAGLVVGVPVGLWLALADSPAGGCWWAPPTPAWGCRRCWRG